LPVQFCKPAFAFLPQSPGSAAATMEFGNAKFGAVALALQALFVWRCLPHSPSTTSRRTPGCGATQPDGSDRRRWALRTAWDRTTRDVHVMIFAGFGFLMTFLKWYGFCSVGLNMLISALVIQWGMLLLAADFACAAVLISFGAMLGRLSPLQCLVLSLVEIPIFVANEYVGLYIFKAADMGGSMFVHVFGAYFGIAASKALTAPGDGKNSNDHSGYSSDLFAMIGTIFLWLYWPSFNAGLASGDDKHRAVINTYLSLAACTVVAYAASALFEKGKFEMSHIQNATLAGGVAVGTVADMMIRPYGALIIGCLAGLLSVFGYAVIAKKLRAANILDTCGVNNLHGMPGLLAGLLGIIYSASASLDDYGNGLYQIFPARAPVTANGSAFEYVVKDGTLSVEGGGAGRSAGSQAAFQAAALGLTLLCAVLGGLLTGFILRLPILDPNFFQDDRFWHVPSNYDARPFGGEGSVPLNDKEAEEPAILAIFGFLSRKTQPKSESRSPPG
uniref:Ammonium_transp domain-containing protein n=1 Tax=Macrostomum lignano TaxID=282301 RepID=A0A1I8F528_9PLAT